MIATSLVDDLRELESETFEIADLAELSTEYASTSCCSCSCSSTCSCSSSCGSTCGTTSCSTGSTSSCA
jgi:thiazolylpeptide-type bacteriocin precursor